MPVVLRWETALGRGSKSTSPICRKGGLAAVRTQSRDAGCRHAARRLPTRFGDTQRFAAAQQQLIELGATLDIDFRFDGDRHMPNTRACHLLLRYAAWYDERHETCLQHALKERLLAAYFTQGRNLSERETLVEIACDAGFERSSAEQALDDVTLRAEVIEVERELQSLGVSGVPTYIFERKFAFSGAQPVDVFLAALDRAAAGEQ
jgi:predicted DsbA family dithiol-disulfide isomerase